MTTFQIILILATTLFMFVVHVFVRIKAQQYQQTGLDALFDLARKQLGIEDETFLDPLQTYKERKRVRLIVNGRVAQEVSLVEHENLATMNGHDPEGAVEFKIEIQEEKEGGGPIPFKNN